MRLVIFGPPRTKKNHGKRIKRGRRVYSVQSDAAYAWEQLAVVQLKVGLAGKSDSWQGTYSLPTAVRALVYRDADRGDLVGYLQAIGDALEKAGVIANDRLIASWDGSRLLVDRERPRVEIEIEAMA